MEKKHINQPEQPIRDINRATVQVDDADDGLECGSNKDENTPSSSQEYCELVDNSFRIIVGSCKLPANVLCELVLWLHQNYQANKNFKKDGANYVS